MDANIIAKALQTSEMAAIACYPYIGKGNEKDADEAAVQSMKISLQSANFISKVVIGEGERDLAPMLYIGEVLGQGNMTVDIAVDPLEGTTLCAHDAPGAITVIAIAPTGTLLNAPDLYMEKIAVGCGLPANVVDLDATPTSNLYSLAKAKGCSVSDLSVAILKRGRHQVLIEEIRKLGVKIKLIADGDVIAALMTAISTTNIDMYIGIGGAPEGVLAAAALKCLGGQMQGRLLFYSKTEEKKAHNFGIIPSKNKYCIDDMVTDRVVFAATGVTDGFLRGVQKCSTRHITHSLLLSYMPKMKRYITSEYTS